MIASDATIQYRLRACPFCGSRSIWLQNTPERPLDVSVTRMTYFACLTCKAYGPDAPTTEQAIAAWNHRGSSPWFAEPPVDEGYDL